MNISIVKLCVVTVMKAADLVSSVGFSDVLFRWSFFLFKKIFPSSRNSQFEKTRLRGELQISELTGVFSVMNLSIFSWIRLANCLGHLAADS